MSGEMDTHSGTVHKGYLYRVNRLLLGAPVTPLLHSTYQIIFPQDWELSFELAMERERPGSTLKNRMWFCRES